MASTKVGAVHCAGDDVSSCNKILIVHMAVKNQMHSVEAWSLSCIYNEPPVQNFSNFPATQQGPLSDSLKYVS